MTLERIVKWIIYAIALLLAVSLLGVVFEIAGSMLQLTVRVLLVLLLVGIVLRVFDVWKDNR